MQVIKRNGRQEPANFDKIAARLKRLTYGLGNKHCDTVLVARKVFARLSDNVTTVQVDKLTAETACAMSGVHRDYALLAGRIAVSILHRSTLKSFSETIKIIYEFYNKSGEEAPLISDDIYKTISMNAARLDSEIIHARDFDYDYYSFKSLEKLYLLKINGRVAERPQHMLMRVAISIHKTDVDSAIDTYLLMSRNSFSPASMTQIGDKTLTLQLRRCFILGLKNHSNERICDTLKDREVLTISGRRSGDSVCDISATGSYIHGTNESSCVVHAMGCGCVTCRGLTAELLL